MKTHKITQSASDLRDAIQDEAYYGFNLGIILGDLMERDPKAFLTIRTVMNDARNARHNAGTHSIRRTPVR